MDYCLLAIAVDRLAGFVDNFVVESKCCLCLYADLVRTSPSFDSYCYCFEMRIERSKRCCLLDDNLSLVADRLKSIVELAGLVDVGMSDDVYRLVIHLLSMLSM